MSPAHHRPRHREVGRARPGAGRSGRVAAVLGLAVVVGSGVTAASGGTSSASPGGAGAALGASTAATGTTDAVADLAVPAPGASDAGPGRRAAAESARWTADADARTAAQARADRAVAAAALAAADGVEAVRIAPEPPADLAALDAAVVDLRAALAADRTTDAADRTVAAAGPDPASSAPASAPGTEATPSTRAPETTAPGTPAPEASAAAGAPAPGTPAPGTPALDEASAEVFRLALAVERALPAAGDPGGLPSGATPADPTVVAADDPVADLEAAASDAAALARALPAAGSRLGADLVGPGPARATPGMLRQDGTVDPAVLCEVPFAPGALLRCDAVEALLALDEVYVAEFGEHLPVGSTYRSYAEQVRLKAAKGGLAAQPGTSHHGWGVAVDFAGFGGVGQFDAPLFRWMSAHAPAFGWVHPAELGPGGSGPQEPWHWEFAGTSP